MKRLALALAAVSVLALPACGAAGATSHGSHGGHTARTAEGSAARASEPVPEGSAAPASASSGAFNDADVMFLQMMIPHHRQGMEMAALAGTRSARDSVRTLAAAVGATQGDEAAVMTRWLEGWKQPLTAEAGAHDAHGGLHATRPEEITELAKLTGAEFDARFLNVLVAHQHNAVEMARTEIRTGRHPRVKQLARMIDQSRSAQIREMLGELAS
ncbi:DUF305 domain-containing protein [Planomonospora sp. ID67723]|uniref:DUF305 domain-containing protein n=1 Tax=Planomonospora sp. ID67723 TaxID=2738134 RepID=UPI0018C3C2B1|nr:DUF305 domain-containing protein [Planomonospora sp. ID67723]MBG0826744.1 DUF305 domain-containing protein [Planomonospora sp. ID67723]